MGKRAVVLAAAALLAAVGGEAGAAPAEVTTPGRCEFTVNTGLAGAGNQCRSVTARFHDKSGHILLRLNYDDPSTVELYGPAMRPTATWTMVAVRRLTWSNSGGPAQVLLDREDGHDEVSGRCAVAFNEGGTAITSVRCDLKSDLGDIKVEFDSSGAER